MLARSVRYRPVPRLVALDIPWDEGFVRAVEDVWSAGDAIAPLDPRLPPPAARELTRTLRPTHVLTRGGELVTLEGGLPTEPGDAVVVGTSGSTGAPKAVVMSRAAVKWAAESTSRMLEVDPSSDTWLACIPLSHVGGLGVVSRSLITGTPVVVHPRFRAADVAKAADRGVTLVSLVSAALARIDPSRFKKILLGGAAPPAVTAPNVVTTYGLTETFGGVVYDGLPLDGVEVTIGDGELGLPGEVLVRGPTLLRCYREGTNPLLAGGWFATGDHGEIGSDGRLRVSGRISETINTGGEKVWPAAVERVIAVHPNIAGVAVCGRPDPEWGEKVVAFVELFDPARPVKLEEIRTLVRERISAWAAPREVVVLGSIPRLASGKVARNQLP